MKTYEMQYQTINGATGKVQLQAEDVKSLQNVIINELDKLSASLTKLDEVQE